MTDKPTPNKDKTPEGNADKANTITKSTQQSDKKPSLQTSQDYKKAPSNNKPSASTADKAVKPEVTKKTTETDKTSPSPKNIKKAMKPESKTDQEKQPEKKSKVSKLAILSLLIALLAVVGVVLLYFWHIQQQTDLITQLQQVKNETVKGNRLAQEQMLKSLQLQEQSLADQFSHSAQSMKEETKENIEQLNLMVEKFSQNQPTDWLVHEAEYLVRVAARTLWLEKDTTAAIGLLQDADTRIAELNDPEILPIRQLIYQDIEALRLAPKLETEEAILSLMALSGQVQSLTLVTLVVPQEVANEDRYTLSEDVADWRENIAKTWDKFLQTFVVVHSRVGEIEPILPAEQREHLKESLTLKLQIAQWAASKGKQALFIESLNDAQLWLTQYFDMNDEKNIAFIDAIENVKNKVILIEEELKLVSLKAIRVVLEEKKSIPAPTTSPVAEVSAPIEDEVTEELQIIEEPLTTVETEVTSETTSETELNVTPENTPTEKVIEKVIEEQIIEKAPKTEEADIPQQSEKLADKSEAA